MTYFNAVLDAVLFTLSMHLMITTANTAMFIVGLISALLSFVFFVREISKILEARREARYAAEIEQPAARPAPPAPIITGNPGPFASDLYPPRPLTASVPTASLNQPPWEQPVAPVATVTPSPIILGGIVGGAAGFAAGAALAHLNRSPIEAYEPYAPSEPGILAAARAAERDEDDSTD